MEKLTEFLVKEIAQNKDAVKVSSTVENETTIINVDIAEEDMGRIIGKQGKTANAIRTIVRSIANNNRKVVIKFN